MTVVIILYPHCNALLTRFNYFSSLKTTRHVPICPVVLFFRDDRRCRVEENSELAELKDFFIELGSPTA